MRSSIAQPAEHEERSWPIPAAGALVLAVAGFLMAFYVGFQASDDASYLSGAIGWIESFPYVGDTHWTLRHTITLPTAAFIWAFGLNETAVSLTNILYFCAFLVANAWFVTRHLGWRVAWVATTLIAVLPGFTVVATYLNTDVAELFFVSLAFWLIATARLRPDSGAVAPWAVAGLALGAAFITRQTAAAAVMFVGGLCVLAPRVPRSRYLVAAVAFAAVVACDWIYLTAMTGDPSYRLAVDFNHDRVDRFAEAARVAATGALLDKEGNLSISVYLDPLLALFASQKYALLFWFFVPASVSLWRRRQALRTDALLLACCLAGVYFVFVAANPKLYLVPRYLIIAAWCAAVVVAWWLVTLYDRGRRFASGAAFCALVLAGVAALSVENTNPRFIERQLVGWVAGNPGKIVHTDPETAIRARFYFRFAGQDIGTVSTDPPEQGSVVFHSRERLAQCAVMPRCQTRARQFAVGQNWNMLESFSAPPRPIGRAIQAVGLAPRMPRDFASRLLTPGGTAAVYVVGQAK